MAPTSMKELSIRYMEPFRTSLDIIHTYGTHVNMSIFFSDQLQRCLKPPSPRRPRSSHRPRHGKPRIYTCRSRRARNAQRSDEANPIPQSHKRHRSRSLPVQRHCHRAARTGKSPLPCANASADDVVDHGRKHSDGVHHASTLKPQLRAAVHLKPP